MVSQLHQGNPGHSGALEVGEVKQHVRRSVPVELPAHASVMVCCYLPSSMPPPADYLLNVGSINVTH